MSIVVYNGDKVCRIIEHSGILVLDYDLVKIREHYQNLVCNKNTIN